MSELIENSIRVQVQDIHSFSTILAVNETTTCEQISTVITSKLGLQDDEKIFYTLICVYSGMKDKEYINRLLTLKSTDLIYDIKKYITNKLLGYDMNTDTCTITWYFKDIRSPPLDLEGETSGNSSSDDETEISYSDLHYFGPGDRRGFLLKRSSKDPNLWRRRLCILNDKLWCVNVHKKTPYASCIELDGDIFLQEEVAKELKYPHGIIIRGEHATTIFLRAASASEQHRWRDELQDKAAFTIENGIIKMAELIICGEEEAISCKRQNTLNQAIQTAQINSKLIHVYDSIKNISPPVAVTTNDDEIAETVYNSSGSSNSSTHSGYATTIISPKPSDCSQQFIIHQFHNKYPACASAISLLKAISDYKSYFRHDLGHTPCDLWIFALRIYIDHILPHLTNAGYIGTSTTTDTNSNTTDVLVSTTTSNSARSHCLSHALYIPLSMDIVTRTHRKIFSNIRRKKKSEGALNRYKARNARRIKEGGASSSEGGWTNWFWGSTEEDNSCYVPEGKSDDVVSADKSDVNAASSKESDYEVINYTVEPEIELFDELVRDLFQVLNGDTQIP